MTKRKIAEKIVAKISNKLGVPKSEIRKGSSFKSIGIDSLDGVEIIVDMEDELKINVPDNKLLLFQSVESLADYFEASINCLKKKRTTRKLVNA